MSPDDPDRTPLSPVTSTGWAVTLHVKCGIGAIREFSAVSHQPGAVITALFLIWIAHTVVTIGVVVIPPALSLVEAVR
jgi:hypothetical protein